MVEPIPEGYPRVTPYLIVDGASDAIDFYTSVLGATERMRMGGPEGKVGHAELEIGDSVIMLADEHPEMGAVGPKTTGGTPVSLHVYVEDVDSAFEQALEAGATELAAARGQVLRRPLRELRGSRSATVARRHARRGRPADEMEKRAAEAAGG